MSAGISIREFARRDGCDDGLVRRALKAGRLKALPDGTIDPALVGSGWRKTNRRADQGADSAADTPRTSAPAPQPTPMPEGDDLAAAELRKERALANLRQLEYDQKSGAVVPVADVTKAVGEEYARVRTRLLAIPAEQAPRLHRCQTVLELQDALMSLVVRALEELTRDGGTPAAEH